MIARPEPAIGREKEIQNLLGAETYKRELHTHKKILKKASEPVTDAVHLNYNAFILKR